MSDEFPIYQVEQVNRAKVNTRSDSEGRFYKYWCSHPQLGRCLFKAAAPDGFTVEERRLDWHEKVAAELGKLLGLPIARTELAVGYVQELETYISGTLSVDYTPAGGQIMSGRRFLSIADPSYDVEQVDGADFYNIENILSRLQENLVGLPVGWTLPSAIAKFTSIETGADLMVGYLLFDAWLSATDRHDENWELALLEDGYRLCPTFDHGDSLGAKLSLEEIRAKDFGAAKLVESCWWKNRLVGGQVSAVEISTAEAFAIGAKIRPLAARVWLECLDSVDVGDIQRIFEQVPKVVVDAERSQFAIDLLEFNRQNLLKSFSSSFVHEVSLEENRDGNEV
jgi:hypothetical protein